MVDRETSALSSDQWTAAGQVRAEYYRDRLAAVKENAVTVVIVGQSITDGQTEVFSLDPLARIIAVLRACGVARQAIRRVMFIGAHQQFVDLLQRSAGLLEPAATVLMESFARETPGIAVRSIDVEDRKAPAVAAVLAAELLDEGEALEVVYRDGQRLVAHLAPCNFRRVAEPKMLKPLTEKRFINVFLPIYI